jgi:methionyl-tRNA formyltransferase
MDSGPVIIQREVPISGETDSVALEDKLRLVGSDLLIEALERIKTNKYKLLEQDENKVVFAPKLKKFDGHINWSNSAQSIHDLIRGTLPWPSAFTHYKGKLLKIYKSEVIDASTKSAGLSCGQVAAITKEAIIVVTGEGDLAVKELQLEGGHRMIAKDFVHGHKVALGYAFGKK